MLLSFARLRQSQTLLADSERTSRELGEKLEGVQLAANTAETDLKVEKQWRQSLQASLLWSKTFAVSLRV